MNQGVQGCGYDAVCHREWNALKKLNGTRRHITEFQMSAERRNPRRAAKPTGPITDSQWIVHNLRGVNGSYPLRTMQDRHRKQEYGHRVHQQVKMATRGQNPQQSGSPAPRSIYDAHLCRFYWCPDHDAKACITAHTAHFVSPSGRNALEHSCASVHSVPVAEKRPGSAWRL